MSLFSCNEPQVFFGAKNWEFRQVNSLVSDTVKLPNPSYFWEQNYPRREGLYELRAEVEIDQPLDSFQVYGLSLDLLASYDVYWDGRFIGSNGKWGKNAQEEKPGQYHYISPIPISLRQEGKHEIYLKLSNFHSKGNVRFYGIVFADYPFLSRWNMTTTVFIHIYAGFFLIIALYFFVIFLLNQRQFSLLLFALISLCFFGLILFEYVKFYYDYPYPWHFTRLRIIHGLTFGIGLLLPLFYSIQTQFAYKKTLLCLLIILFSIYTQFGFGYDGRSWLIMLTTSLFSLFLILRAYQQQQTGSLIGLIGIAPFCFSILLIWDYYDIALFAGFGHLILMVLISLALQAREQRRQHEVSLLRSSRLELELLKKNIQPHFLMNSITSAIDWMEENPQKGVKLLYALSEELNIMLDISHKTLIPLKQEIALCRAHLEVMNYRKDKNYILLLDNCEAETWIPPAILHTLVENGISHDCSDDKEVRFYIKYLGGEEKEQYEVQTGRAGERLDEQSQKEGTGIRYIKARLEESFPGCWEFYSSAGTTGWETRIIFKKKAFSPESI